MAGNPVERLFPCPPDVLGERLAEIIRAKGGRVEGRVLARGGMLQWMRPGSRWRHPAKIERRGSGYSMLYLAGPDADVHEILAALMTSRVECTYNCSADVLANQLVAVVRAKGGRIEGRGAAQGKKVYVMFIGPWGGVRDVPPRRAEAAIEVIDTGASRLTIDVVPEGQADAEDVFDALAADPIVRPQHNRLVPSASSISRRGSATTSSRPSTRGVLMTIGVLAVFAGIIVGIAGAPGEGTLMFVAGLFVFIVANPNMALWCPHCNRWVATFATVCQHCGRDIRSGKVPTE